MNRPLWVQIPQLIHFYLAHMDDVEYCKDMIILATASRDFRGSLASIVRDFQALASDTELDCPNPALLLKWLALQQDHRVLLDAVSRCASLKGTKYETVMFRHIYAGYRGEREIGCYGFTQFTDSFSINMTS